jgi:hypothetical protein
MIATWTAWDAVVRCVLLLAILLVVVGLVSVARAADQGKNRTRGDVETALATAERAFTQQPDKPEVRQELAQLLFEWGDFWRASDVVRPLVDAPAPSAQAIRLAAELEYLQGHYGQAESLYRKLLEHAQADQQSRATAKVGLGFVYYQTNRFDRFAQLDFGRGVVFPGEKLIKSFDTPPYRVTWQRDERVSEVPFVVADPLPVLRVEYDQRPVHVLFDTGADMCILDSDLARQWGIKEESFTFGSFGGGKIGRMGYGKLQSVKIGDVTLEGVPISILPTRRFSAIFADGKFSIGGIIGSGLIRQFLATIDYRHERLVLAERSPQARQTLRKQLEGRVVGEVPFVLYGTHWMMARGTLDNHADLTFFVDSGLAADAAFSAPRQTLRYAGIAEPQRKVAPNAIGGGGGPWATGQFPIKALGLGSLRQHDLKGEYGSRPDTSYWQCGFIQDGLISHRFLRKYDSWSIDFDGMTYLFADEAGK